MLSEEWSRADQIFSIDYCLTGCGGWMNGRYFHCSFPDFLLSENLHMNLCEMLTVVVALKASGSNFSGKKIVIHCDNLVTVRVINTGASRNKFLVFFKRNMLYRCY